MESELKTNAIQSLQYVLLTDNYKQTLLKPFVTIHLPVPGRLQG